MRGGGGAGTVVVADFEHNTDGKAAPYSLDELHAARGACDELPYAGPIHPGRFEEDGTLPVARPERRHAGPIHLERFEERHEALLPRLYPYEPKHLLLRHEMNELFDTSPDLSGADIDISRFIRSGDERDVQVFWAEVGDGGPAWNLKPTREELCSVPFLKVRDWLCLSKNSEKLKSGVWVWDWLSREWRSAQRRDIFPGQTMLVESGVGGYRCNQGWDPRSEEAVPSARLDEEQHYASQPCWRRDGDGWRPGERRVRALPPDDLADDSEEDESLSVADGWQTIASHGLQVGEEVERIAKAVAPSEARLLHLAGRWHDLGKAHPAFQCSINSDDRPERNRYRQSA